ncbi:MAG: hypothetical protein ISS31_05095 [Kiritimatiellae bacterium]|nr:hypothetical protein [Kiritimatiellia bacterium]
MNRRSRLTILVGSLLFLGLALWWSVWFPFAPERVRGAIPSHALMVGEHHRLGDDADLLLQNTSLRESIQVLGGDVEAIDEFMTSRFGRWLTACLGGRYTVTAFAPRSPVGAPAAWMAASWGGVHAQVMRWMMEAGLISGWDRLPGRSPIVCYTLRSPGTGPVLSATVYEGVVLLAYSRDPGAVRRMVRRVAYGQPASRLPVETVPTPDRVQVCWTPRADVAPRAEYTWSLPSTNAIGVHATWSSRMPLPIVRPETYRGEFPVVAAGIVCPPVDAPTDVQLSESERRDLGAGLGSLSGALMLVPSAILDVLPGLARSPAIGALYRETIREKIDPKGVIALGLLRDTYSGRLLGIKTPSLVLAVKTSSELDLAAELPPLLDRWNARLGLSLLARERGSEGIDFPVFIVDEARNGIYSSMKASEKPALWQAGNWLFIASNLAAAREVSRAIEQSAEPPQGAWWSAAAATPGMVHGWFDFKAAGSAVRKLMALHAIVQIAQGERSGPAVVLMERTGRAVSALEPFGEGSLKLELGRDAWTMDVRVGH